MTNRLTVSLKPSLSLRGLLVYLGPFERICKSKGNNYKKQKVVKDQKANDGSLRALMAVSGHVS